MGCWVARLSTESCSRILRSELQFRPPQRRRGRGIFFYELKSLVLLPWLIPHLRRPSLLLMSELLRLCLPDVGFIYLFIYTFSLPKLVYIYIYIYIYIYLFIYLFIYIYIFIYLFFIFLFYFFYISSTFSL